MSAPMQPGDVRVNRGNLLRRIGRVCFDLGGQPGLPAPHRVEFTPAPALIFDSYRDASEWADRLDLHGREIVVDDVRQICATGSWDGWEIAVIGSSKLDPRQPADTDPDDLSVAAGIADHYDASAEDGEYVCACGVEFLGEPYLVRHIAAVNPKSVEDAPPRGTDAAEATVPKPATVEGHGKERGGVWHTQPSGEHRVIEPANGGA